MRTEINRWGNSLAMRIPRHIVKELGLRKGDPVTIEYRDGSIYIRKAEAPSFQDSEV